MFHEAQRDGGGGVRICNQCCLSGRVPSRRAVRGPTGPHASGFALFASRLPPYATLLRTSPSHQRKVPPTHLSFVHHAVSPSHRWRVGPGSLEDYRRAAGQSSQVVGHVGNLAEGHKVCIVGTTNS